MAQKGLVLVYDPHNLMQFVWYYCTYGTSKKWDALCLPNAHKGEYMSEYCKKSGIFENVIKDDKEFLNSHLFEQFKLFTRMTGYALIKKQKKFCEKVLSGYVNLDDYDEIVVLTDVGLISGFCLTFADTKRVVILEDGTADYLVRSYKNFKKNLANPADWKGYFLSKMGYSNVGHNYPLKTTKNCIKFSSHRDVMPYQDYKEHLVIFDFSKTNMALYNSIIEKIYDQIREFDFDKYDTVLFTCCLADFIHDTEEYQSKMEKFLEKTTGNLMIKRHPRDTIKLNLADNIDACEIPQSIPAEVILPYIKGKTIVFMQVTSILLYLKSEDYNCKCVYFDGLYEKSMKDSMAFCKYASKEELFQRLDMFKCKDMEVIDIKV